MKTLNQIEDTSTNPLKTIYENTGNSMISGFLGEPIQNASYDEEGHFTFSTRKKFSHSVVTSEGVVLPSGVLIQQVQKEDESTTYRLYSWDVDENQYTVLSFDQEQAMRRFFETICRFDLCLCDDDISTLLQEMGLTLESVMQIYVNQKVTPRTPVSTGDKHVR